MYSREESKKVRQEFWTEFGKEYPRKWILYNTKIREIQLKFTFTTKFAQVSLDVASPDEIVQEYYCEKLTALKNVFISEYLPSALLEENHLLPEGKAVCRAYVQLDGVNIHRQKDWPLVREFLYQHMARLEQFFLDFRDYLED